MVVEITPVVPVLAQDPKDINFDHIVNQSRCNTSSSRHFESYHDANEIANYWDYASNFVLPDHMFSSQLGPSRPSHNYLVSGWSAVCTDPADASTCTSSLINLLPNDQHAATARP